MEDFMKHQLPTLPYPPEALAPHISSETMNFHYGKHHKSYVEKLNQLIKGTPYEQMSLEEIIVKSEGPIFNNSAQHWNHTFFWNCLSPYGGGNPTGPIGDLILKQWKTFSEFKENFSSQALNNFGSGWTWLVQNNKGELEIENTSNADNPLKHHAQPILTLDIWEHAYYIDFRNEREEFIKAFWNVVNWNFANNNLKLKS
jgi:superoxide dismutase, Fe-Mn family